TWEPIERRGSRGRKRPSNEVMTLGIVRLRRLSADVLRVDRARLSRVSRAADDGAMIWEQRDRVVTNRAAKKISVTRDLTEGGRLGGDGVEGGDLAPPHFRHAELDRVATAEDGRVAPALAGKPRKAIFRLGIRTACRAPAGSAKLIEIQLPHLIVPKINHGQLAADCVCVAGEELDPLPALHPPHHIDH